MNKNKRKIKNIKNFFEKNNLNFGFIVLILITLIINSIGFKIMFEENNLHGNWFYYIYNSIRLFGFDLQTPKLDTPLPWPLEIGCWLAGAVTIWAIGLAISNIFRDKLKLFKKGKNHIIIVGTGNKGKTLGLDWLKKTQDKSHKDYRKLVVFIEKDKNNPNIDILRENGAVVILGDAKDKEVLQKAKIKKANYLVTLTDSDVTNMEIVSTIAIMKNIKNKISCYINLIHNEFYEFFNIDEFNNKNSELDIKIFNINTNAARILFGDKNHLLGANVFTDAKKIRDKNVKVKIAIFGFRELGESILLHVLQLGHFYNENPIEITVVYDNDKNENANLLDEFIKQYNVGIKKGERKNSELEDYWKIEFIDDGEFINKNISEYSQIIIAYENEFESLSNLMKLFKKESDKILSNNIDISVYLNTLENVAKIIQKNKLFKNIRTFGELNKTCNYNIVINEELDKKAILNNKQYNELHGYDDKNKIAEEEWQNLGIFLKDSNRYAIEYNKIRKYMINKLIESSNVNNDYETLKNSIKEKFYNYEGMKINWDEMDLKNHEYTKRLSEEDIIQLAKVEHKRWNAFHILNGWKKREIPTNAKEKIEKNKDKKLHPCLVSWEELDNVSKNHNHNYKSDDIETIMRIPSLDNKKENNNGN
jgi:Trk K+ transport system NAD-binding subunit